MVGRILLLFSFFNIMNLWGGMESNHLTKILLISCDEFLNLTVSIPEGNDENYYPFASSPYLIIERIIVNSVLFTTALPTELPPYII